MGDLEASVGRPVEDRRSWVFSSVKLYPEESARTVARVVVITEALPKD